MWTINRGLRTIAGIFILMSIFLSIIHSRYWLLFTAFIGINLFQSGFTNWCGMMQILKRVGLREGELEGVLFDVTRCNRQGVTEVKS
ncbi:MAG: DUF2892 domain-containing protein [Nitrospinae bacterium]|nr:DUF2892 domain-containing protein [Nitrospinota bacterium]